MKLRFGLIAVLFIALALIVVLWTQKSVQASFTCGSPQALGAFEEGATAGVFEGKNVAVPPLAETETKNKVLGVASSGERWIEVGLSEQKLRAWDGDKLYLETLVSTGLPWFPTPTGEFRIWIKLRFTRMEGGTGVLYYNLPNVPFVMFIESDKVPGWRGYSLHGTYWHNDFGKVHSHGCVNLPTSVAEKLYYWTSPTLPEGQYWVRATPENPGTKVVIHE